MAGVGASLFLAYVVEATWLAARFDLNRRSEAFLGFITGLAIWGFVGVGLLLYLSEGHLTGPLYGNDSRYFWISTSSLALLGLSVAFQPAVTHTWLHASKKQP
jgi:hypothetical protein